MTFKKIAWTLGLSFLAYKIIPMLLIAIEKVLIGIIVVSSLVIGF